MDHQRRIGTVKRARGGGYNRPRDWQAFERLSRDIFAALYDDPHADLNGRQGQPQAGVDIQCRAKDGSLIGVQCKHHDMALGRPTSLAEFEAEIEKARSHIPPLNHFVLLTTGPNDVQHKRLAQTVTDAHRTSGGFAVAFHGWDWLETQLDAQPDLAVQYGLTAVVTDAIEGGVAQAIGRRFHSAIDLINAGRDQHDHVTLTEIAEILGFPDWRELERIGYGISSAGTADLKAVAEGLGLRSDWLLHGKGAPFTTDDDLPDAFRQFDALAALKPLRTVFVRSSSEPFDVVLAIQTTALRWRVFTDYHPASGHVGGTGSRQLFELCWLIRRIYQTYWPQNLYPQGLHVSAADFDALMTGEAYPGSLLRQRRDDGWWQDFGALAAHLVTGKSDADEALREAIRIARLVVEDIQNAKNKEGWRQTLLREAGLHLERPDDTLAYDLDGPTPREPVVPPRPKPPLTTSWPKVAALMVEEVKFTFSGGHDGTLLDGHCHMDLANRTRVALTSCGVFVVSIDDGENVYPVEAFLRVGRVAGGEANGFTINPGQRRRFIICRRDLKDIITCPPWVLLLEGEDWPLFDGRRHILTLELRSNYEFPTRVRLSLEVGYGKAVKAEILDQPCEGTN